MVLVVVFVVSVWSVEEMATLVRTSMVANGSDEGGDETISSSSVLETFVGKYSCAPRAHGDERHAFVHKKATGKQTVSKDRLGARGLQSPVRPSPRRAQSKRAESTAHRS